MAAKKGNQLWKARSSHGRQPIFKSADDLWTASCEYFEWVEKNPLIEIKCFSYQGVVTQEPVAKMRAMTVGALCLFLDISHQTWRDYCARDDFIEITEKIDLIIRSQKFEGAAAELLNPNIIARDLGLRDRADIDHGLQENNPISELIKQISGKTIDPNG